MHRKLLGISLAVLVVLAVIVLTLDWRIKRDADTVRARRGPIVEAVYGLGTVTPTRTFNLKPAITTAIVKLYVREGMTVERGARLVTFDEGGTRHAPFSGTITALNYKVSETVFTQTTVLTLIDLRDRYVVVSLEQQGALRVRPGQGAQLSFESLRGRKFEGSVRAIFPQEGQFIVHIDVAKLPPEILPGMTADVAIEIDRKDDAMLVPVSAISAGKVTVRRGSKRQKVDVTIGIIDGQWAEVTSGGLDSRDLLVVRKR